MKYEEDVCASCQWAEPENMDLKLCTSCDRPTCHECRTKHKARCGYCASYDFPKRIKILLGEMGRGGFWMADVHVQVTMFYGIGQHYHVDVTQNRRKARGKTRWCESGKTAKPNRIKDIILKAIREHHPRKKVVTVYFKQNRVRRWFYREGD